MYVKMDAYKKNIAKILNTKFIKAARDERKLVQTWTELNLKADLITVAYNFIPPLRFRFVKVNQKKFF